MSGTRNSLFVDGRFSPDPAQQPPPKNKKSEPRYEVLVDLPTFSDAQIEAWLFKMHALFRRYYVNSERDRKYQFLHVLPCAVFGEVRDYFDWDPPRPGQFMQIIQKLLQLFTPSEQERKKQEIEEMVRRVALNRPDSKVFLPARTKCGQLLRRKCLPRSPNWVLMFGQLRYPNLSIPMSSPAKLRPFSKTAPEIWFFQARLMFKCQEVECVEDKYFDVVACLPDDVIYYVTDILEDPPERPYVTLVARLFYLYAPDIEADSERSSWLTADPMNFDFTDQDEMTAILESFREFRSLHPPRPTHLSVLPPSLEEREESSKSSNPDLHRYVICWFHYEKGCGAGRCALPCNWDRLFKREEDFGHCHPKFRKTVKPKPKTLFFICRYHHKWGTEALKCTKICNWERIFGRKEVVPLEEVPPTSES